MEYESALRPSFDARHASTSVFSDFSEDQLYPFQQRFAAIGLLAGTVGAIVWGSVMAGFAFVTVFACVGLTWRRNEPPILPFCLAYQWFFVVTGYLYGTQTGGYLDDIGFQNFHLLERAIGLSLVGFLVLAAGIRLSWGLFAAPPHRTFEGRFEDARRYEIRRLFWIVGFVFLLNWFVEAGPGILKGLAAGQIIEKVLDFKEALLVMLLALVLHRGCGYRYVVTAFAVAIVPQFASTQTDFKTFFFYIIIMMATEWRPGTKLRILQARNRQIVTVSAAICAVILVSGVVWEGAVKPVWRWAEVEGTPIERAQAFFEISSEAVEHFEFADGVNALITRVESTGQFVLVLQRVPRDLPHEHGVLLRRTIEHVTMPRILFPDKAALNATDLATTYAGLDIREGTSVGIGYMAEFYVDFGDVLMFIPMLLYGMLIGAVYTLIARHTRSFALFSGGVIVIFVDHFTSYEGEFAKLVGGLIMSAAIFIVIARLIEPRLQGWIRSKEEM